MYKLIKIIAILFVATTLSACGSLNFFKKKEEASSVKTVEEMYNGALDKIAKKKYAAAIDEFEDIERTYPYSKWAIKSQVMSAYASYKDGEYEKTLATIERFIKLHPGNKDVPYAYYLRAVSYYEQISDVTRDQSYTRYAKAALNEVIARFPGSEYARDAAIKIDLTNDHLAGKEMEVGRFYQKQGNHIAAINRFKEVIDEYETTLHVQEALHRLVESYMILGVKEEAKKYGAVLGYNYPGSKWYDYSYRLIEGRRPSDADKKHAVGKWYSLQNLKNFKFQLPFRTSESGNDLIESIENSKDDVRDFLIRGEGVIEKRRNSNTPIPVSKNEKGLFGKIGGWFKGLKKPFSREK